MTTRQFKPDEQMYQREGSRFARVDLNGMAETVAQQYRARAQSAGLPPIAFDSVREIMRGFASSINGILLDSDYALRKDRRLQRMMRRDPDVMSPLFQRLYSIAELEWTITPPDEEDEKEVKRAAHLKQLIEHKMRRRTEFFKQLADASWFGPAAVNVIFDRVKVPLGPGIAPIGWKPIHSDSLEFDEFGDLGMKVGQAYTGESIIGHNGRVRMFTSEEREAIILHVWNPEGPDYDEPREAKYIYAGRGLRDICYNFWVMKQTALKLWMIWIQRHSMGDRIFRYPMGSTTGKAEMEKAARNWANDTSLIVPHDPDDPDAWKIDLTESKGVQAKIFADLIEGYLSGKLKEMIIGQTATTEATGQGLGTGTSDQHAQTYQRIIKYDSSCLADSLTFELIQPMYIMNYGESDSYPIFKFPIEKVDSEKWMKGAGEFIDRGGAVAEQQMRERLGLDKADEDEPVLMGSVNPASDLDFGGGALDFARMMRTREKYARAMKGN